MFQIHRFRYSISIKHKGIAWTEPKGVTFVRKIIEKAKENLLKHGVKKIETVLLVGDAPQEIVDFAKKEKIDVIIVGDRGL